MNELAALAKVRVRPVKPGLSRGCCPRERGHGLGVSPSVRALRSERMPEAPTDDALLLHCRDMKRGHGLRDAREVGPLLDAQNRPERGMHDKAPNQVQSVLLVQDERILM